MSMAVLEAPHPMPVEADIPNRLLHVFRGPTPDGYANETVLTTDGEVRPLAAPDSAVRVADLLP